jgi:CheY-like chemotaxis protein
VQEHIFEPFFTTKEEGKGTGLGLATVYGIIKSHQGGVRVQSQQDEGTTFEIYLPAVVAVVQAGAQQRPVPGPRGTETVLLVEDDPLVREVVCRMLGDLGYTVLETARGDTALQMCNEHAQTIALLLTDMVLPGLNGYALAEQAATSQPQLKVLYMSGYTERGDRPQGNGANFLSKPFTADRLARAVRQILDGAPPR